MRIGILTYHSVYNFGANLQVLSTVEYLKNSGFEPIVINWLSEDLEVRYTRTTSTEQADAHQKFIENFLPCSEICRTDKDIAQVIENQNIRGIIIGSDAVLQHSTLLSRIHLRKKGIIIDPKPGTDVLFPNSFWGSFIPYLKEKIPVVVMSASSQNSQFKYIRGELKRRMYSSLRQFKSVTVRDEWTKSMVKYLTNGEFNSSITPDPVFGFNQNVREQYSKNEILNKFKLPEKYILLSFRDAKAVSKEWLHIFQLISGAYNLRCVALTPPAGIKFEHPFSLTIAPPLCPKDWYGLIKYSSGYIGENMHPIVVALHNSVPFYSFDSYGIVKYKYFVNEKSSKIYDIVSFAGFLNNRISILGKGYKCPDPESVLRNIIDFDYSKCHLFSLSQQERYNRMMENIATILVS